jgi:hypothetical protein
MCYYFHLHNDVEARDDEGVDLPDQAAAKEHALDEARAMAAESVREGHLDLSHSIEVADHARERLFSVTFGEAVKITGGRQTNLFN